MKNLIINYINNNLTKEEMIKFGIKNNITLSNEELDFTYKFIKTNYNEILNDKNFTLARYKSNFSEQNYIKINELLNKYRQFL